MLTPPCPLCPDYVLIRRDVGDDDRSMHVHVRDDHDMREDRSNQNQQPNGQVEQRFDQGQRHGADVEGDGHGFPESESSAGEKTNEGAQVAAEVTQEK